MKTNENNAVLLVEEYYRSFISHEDGWKNLVSKDVTFKGPVQKANGADEFIPLTAQFQQFCNKAKLLRRVVQGNTVCSEFDYEVNSPSGKIININAAEFTEVEDDKIKSFTIYYDPAEFAKAFGMN